MSKLTSYTALSSVQADDVLPIVDIHDTGMASSGTTKKITVANLRGLRQFFLDDYGADPTGAALSDSAWTAAYAAATAAIQAWAGDTGLTSGAVIVLGAGIYKFSFATVAITDARIGLVGQGASLTKITSTAVTSGALVRVSSSGSEPSGTPGAPVGGFTVWGWDAFGSAQTGFHADGSRAHCRVSDIYAQGFIGTGSIGFKFTPTGGAGWEASSFLGLDAQNNNVSFYFDGTNGGSNNGTLDYTVWNLHSVAANATLQLVNGIHFYGSSVVLHGNIGGGAGTTGANTFCVIGSSSSDTARFQNSQLFLQHEVDSGSSSVTDFTITGTSNAGIIDCYGLAGFVNAGGTITAGSLGGSALFRFQGLIENSPLATAMGGSKFQLGAQLTAVDSGGTGGTITGTLASYNSISMINVVNRYGADPAGVSDSTTAIQSALTAAATAGGGVVYIPAGTYLVSNLTIDTKVVLTGDGPATVLNGKSGSAGYMIALTHPSTTYQATVANLMLKPATGTLGGVQLDNTGWTSGGGETDSMHVLDNVYVQNAGGDGFHFDNNIRSLRMTRCTQYGAGGSGFYIGVGCTDSSFTGCISGPSQGHSWNFSGWNNYVTSCKGFFAGWNGSAFNTTSCCWEIGTNAAYNTFAACSAQNAALHGWDLQSCTKNAFVGCESDGNSQGAATAGCGINTNGATFCTIIGMTGNGNHFGVQVAGTQTGTTFLGNTVAGTSGDFSYVSGGGYFNFNYELGDLSGLSQLKLPGGTLVVGNLDLNTAGTGLQVAEGTNAKQGTAVLVAGSKVVSNTAVTANSRIFLTSQADGGTPGWLRVSARTAGTSFTITSSSGTDTSTVAYEIFEPG